MCLLTCWRNSTSANYKASCKTEITVLQTRTPEQKINTTTEVDGEEEKNPKLEESKKSAHNLF